jgi:hypothetical protein
MITGLKQAFAQTKELRHPLHDLLDLINTTPADMIKLKFEQGEDGSKKFNIEIPSRAEQAKQKAMQQAMQQGSSPVAKTPGAVEDIAPPGTLGQPQQGENVEQADFSPQEKSVAAGNKVEVRIAMTKQDVVNNLKKDVQALKKEFPNGFLKAMDLQ